MPPPPPLAGKGNLPVDHHYSTQDYSVMSKQPAGYSQLFGRTLGTMALRGR
jgi:hypothetical protein